MKTCTKCRRNPRRAENQRWCRACHAAYVKDAREAMHRELDRLRKQERVLERFRKQYGIDR